MEVYTMTMPSHKWRFNDNCCMGGYCMKSLCPFKSRRKKKVDPKPKRQSVPDIRVWRAEEDEND